MDEELGLLSDLTACEAADNVAHYFGYNASGNYLKFWRFVGLDVRSKKELLSHTISADSGTDRVNWKLPSYLIRRIEALASPHCKTFIKAMVKTGAIVPTQPFIK